MTVRRLLSELDSYELTEWFAYFQLEEVQTTSRRSRLPSYRLNLQGAGRVSRALCPEGWPQSPSTVWILASIPRLLI